MPERALDFRAPYNTRRGQPLHGTRMLVSAFLDEALAGWRLEPALVVLLVDADEKPVDSRRSILREALGRNGLEGAVGVAVQEFESWLMADQDALTAVLGPGHASPPDIEAMGCRQAKDQLMGWTTQAARPGRGPFELRIELAKTLDLDVLTKRCGSFRAFRRELANITP